KNASWFARLLRFKHIAGGQALLRPNPRTRDRETPTRKSGKCARKSIDANPGLATETNTLLTSSRRPHPMRYAISRMKSVSLIVDSLKATYVERFSSRNRLTDCILLFIDVIADMVQRRLGLGERQQ